MKHVMRLIWLLLAMTVAIGTVEDAQAETISDVVCETVCPPLRKGLRKVDSIVRLQIERFRNRTKIIAARPFEGRGPECGRLPDAKGTVRCCGDEEARLLIEYAGKNPYVYPETLWRGICRPE